MDILTQAIQLKPQGLLFVNFHYENKAKTAYEQKCSWKSMTKIDTNNSQTVNEQLFFNTREPDFENFENFVACS